MEQSPFPLAHMESPWVGELQPPTPATLNMDLLDKQPGLVWSLMEEPQEHGVEVHQLVKVSYKACPNCYWKNQCHSDIKDLPPSHPSL